MEVTTTAINDGVTFNITGLEDHQEYVLTYDLDESGMDVTGLNSLGELVDANQGLNTYAFTANGQSITFEFISATGAGVFLMDNVKLVTPELAKAEMMAYNDYYPFGMLQPGRNQQSDAYRYGFNGMEKDDEVKGKEGTSYDFGARMYDPRVGRWLSTDAYESEYVPISPYSFGLSNPIYFIDKDGNKIMDPFSKGGNVEVVVVMEGDNVSFKAYKINSKGKRLKEVEPSEKFNEMVKPILEKTASREPGREVIRNIIDSPSRITIKENQDKDDNRNSTLSYSPEAVVINEDEGTGYIQYVSFTLHRGNYNGTLAASEAEWYAETLYGESYHLRSKVVPMEYALIYNEKKYLAAQKRGTKEWWEVYGDHVISKMFFIYRWRTNSGVPVFHEELRENVDDTGLIVMENKNEDTEENNSEGGGSDKEGSENGE